MGLDAVVYRRLEEIALPKDADLDLIRVEEMTGEVYFCGDKPQLAKADVRAVHKRLGNMALISSLHDQISRILGSRLGPSVLLDKVLYNGTHGADVIATEDVEDLKKEISILRRGRHSSLSAEADAFLASMEELIAVSERQGNPIVFI